MAAMGSFVSFGLTHVGLVRRRNEDAFLDRPDRGLWAVADGMGGHQAGDYASTRVVTALDEIVPPPVLQSAGCREALDEYARAAAAALIGVDSELRTRAAALGPFTTIGSTVVALLGQDDECIVLWAGDSRAYRCRGGALRQLTVDHSRVQELVDAGLLPPAEAVGHPESNIVTRAIGAGHLEVGIVRESVQPGDRFLLCSDGLTAMLRNEEIAREIAVGLPQAAAQRLLELALDFGASDNVTIVVIDARAV
jgi:serine/threonine protein phosphatase PrpC